MKTKTSAMIKAGTALALTSFVWTGAAMAQDNDSETVANMSRPADDAASCKAMNWNSELVGTYPWVSEACRAVVVVNGEKWARFQGNFKRSNNDGSFDTEFVSRSDRNLGTVTMTPEPGQRVHLENRDVRFSDLKRDQVLSFYVPEGAMGFALEPGVPSSRMAKVVNTTDESQIAEDDQPVQLAQAETREEERASVLPSTAGPLPLFALGGLMSLLGGLGLTIRRKSLKHNV